MKIAVILASGSGTRFGGHSVPKQLTELMGKPLFVHALETYRKIQEIDRSYLVVNPVFAEQFAKILHEFGWQNEVTTLEGGRTRQVSISNALQAIPEEDGLVVLQNSVSPLTSEELIRECLEAAHDVEAVQAYCPAYHTIFELAGDRLGSVLQRSGLGYTCDPTVYRVSLLRRVFSHLERSGGLQGEDTLSVVRALGVPVTLVRSDYENTKVTTRFDLMTVEAIMRGRAPRGSA